MTIADASKVSDAISSFPAGDSRSLTERVVALEAGYATLMALLAPEQLPGQDGQIDVGGLIVEFLEQINPTMLQQQALMGADASVSPTEAMLRVLIEMARGLDA